MHRIKIPRLVDPKKAVQQQLVYNGIIQASLFKRFVACVEAIEADAQVDMSFEKNEQKKLIISGSASITILQQCQRCNQNFSSQHYADFSCVVSSANEQSDDMDQDDDFVELNEYGEVDLIQMVEDEFILTLPQIAMHDLQDCNIKESRLTFGELPEWSDEESEKPNPFEVLKNLKHE